MNHFLPLWLSLILFSFLACQSSNKATISINVQTIPPLEEGEKIYISGNVHQLGNWRPDQIPLTKSGENWTAKFSFSKNERIEFKFTKGKWENEALTNEGKIAQNHIFTPKQDTTLHFTISKWKDEDFKPEGGITGEVRHHKDLQPKGLPSRDTWVWLPPSYADSTEKRYPVLYMHDGQNVFNPATSFTQIDWQVDEWADSLTRAKKLQEIIVVAIENAPERRKEYAPGPKGELYMNFLCQQVKPLIDSLYRTKPQREYTATMGSSMGGMISFLLVWERTEIFSKAACLSPAFKFLKFNYVPTVRNYKGEKKDIQIYLDNGTEGLEAKLQDGCDEMMAALKEKEYPFRWFLDQGAEHNERAWAKRGDKPLLYLFGKE